MEWHMLYCHLLAKKTEQVFICFLLCKFPGEAMYRKVRLADKAASMMSYGIKICSRMLFRCLC